MIKIPEDILNVFFSSLIQKGKYIVQFQNNKALIIPRDEECYYKPIIVIKNLIELKELLKAYIEQVNLFDSEYNYLKEYHDLEYILSILLFNMTNSDASDFNYYLAKRISFLENNLFIDYLKEKEILELDGFRIYARCLIEDAGLESPYCMLFRMEYNGENYELPLVRYAFDDTVCHLFTVQMGRERECNNQDQNYKHFINQVNSGVKSGRNIPPNFVFSLALFIKLVNEHGIKNIVAPDYLFSRYRHYYKGTTIVRSDEILTRILNRFMELIRRIGTQIEGFQIVSYPNDVDSFMHIELKELRSNNLLLNRIIEKEN